MLKYFSTIYVYAAIFPPNVLTGQISSGGKGNICIYHQYYINTVDMLNRNVYCVYVFWFTIGECVIAYQYSKLVKVWMQYVKRVLAFYSF